ncbi:copper transporter [Actinomyces oris]|uniref:Copper transporter n=1 Tax=Actinomyces oris TaxID=544580 RepID=A0A508BKQ7_9ACTO|nr:copper transporter [Actinomyces oris]QQC40437.1 copper transporter [Actinomyces oris]TQD60288.1 copper transporter [Actinomyces oris]
MIDFRYHLVSLISVFLALAVGVVLGAGPLQNSLGTALNDQVTALRENRNATQAKLEQTETAVNERDSYITQAATSLLPGTLASKNVAMVLLPDAKAEDADAIAAQLKNAGATVTGRVSLTSTWVDLSRENYRSTFSGQVQGHLGSTNSKDANGILGEALAKALTANDDSSRVLMDMLSVTVDKSGTPFISVDSTPTAAAEMIVVVGPRPQASSGKGATVEASPGQDPKVWAKALEGTAGRAPTVVVGSADGDDGVVSIIRSEKAKVTTIDSVGQIAASVSTPLALASTRAGTTGHYGFDKGAEAVMPPVTK